MKTISALAAALLLTTSAVAGSPMHRLAASEPSYELKTDGAPQAGKPLFVTLIDRASGSIVTNGQVAVMRPVYRGPKAVPAVQYEPEALPRTADGRFVCASEHHVAGVTLRGAGPAGISPVWLTLKTNS